MRRINPLALPGHRVMVDTSDFALMRAVVRAADGVVSCDGCMAAIEGMGGEHKRSIQRLQKARDEFNKPRKTK